jgi:hypothetical protein
MTEHKINIEQNANMSFNFLIPSYMRNSNIMYQIKQKVESIKWDIEGKLVYMQ